MMIAEKIKEHFDKKHYINITRLVGKGTHIISRGYIINFSTDFLILQETDDFRALGYNILPVSQIQKIRFNKDDKFYNKIMILENEINKIGIDYKVDLLNWKTIFKSLKEHSLSVIVYCEDPDIDGFTIGPIVKISKKSVYIQYFNASGILDDKPTSIDFESITKIMFDDRYINIFSKYLKSK